MQRSHLIWYKVMFVVKWVPKYVVELSIFYHLMMITCTMYVGLCAEAQRCLRKLKVFCTHNGGEFISAEFENYVKKEGITDQLWFLRLLNKIR